MGIFRYDTELCVVKQNNTAEGRCRLALCSCLHGNPPGMTYSRQELPILSDRKRGDPGDLVANMTDALVSTFCYAVHM